MDSQKRFSRVLLVNPWYKGHYSAFIPAGLGYVAESLLTSGIKVKYFDMGLCKSLPKLTKEIHAFKPDLIGFQIMSYFHRHNLKLIQDIKSQFPEAKTVAGGHHISLLREDVLKTNSFIDFGVVLEGENTIIELCLGQKPLSEIKGLLFRDGDTVKYNGDRDFINCLDTIPYPKMELFELGKYPSQTIPIVSSRGCPYGCIYCPVKLAIGRKYRVRSPVNLVDEIEYWYQKGYRRFGFTDDNFTLYEDRVYEICDEIDRRRLRALDFVCGNGVRADKVSRKLLARMREVGFNWLAFGVEAGNNRMLDRLNKSERIEVIEQAIKDACDLGYDVNLFFLIGSPDETEQDVMDSINLALRYPVANANFYNLIPFPNTELFSWVKQKGYFLRAPEEYLNDASHWQNEPVFETPELPIEKRRRLFKTCREVSKQIKIKYVKRKLHKFRVVSPIISHVYASDFVQEKVIPNAMFKKTAKKLWSLLSN